jgi:hypothetical protein
MCTYIYDFNPGYNPFKDGTTHDLEDVKIRHSRSPWKIRIIPHSMGWNSQKNPPNLRQSQDFFQKAEEVVRGDDVTMLVMS